MSSRIGASKEQDQVLNRIPIFLAKTFRIIDNPCYSDVIGWTAEGDAFIIKSIGRLTTEIFPAHFKHNNFLSFVRQLNMYGFHKVMCSSDAQGQVFKHDCFRRDAVESLLLIKRKTAAEQCEGQVVAVAGREERLEKELSVLRGQHEELQNMMEILIQQNKTITAQNKAFAHMMGQMREKYRKKLETLMLLFLFGKQNHKDFIFPPQFAHVIEAFEQSHNGSSVYMLPQKKRKRNTQLPMITDRAVFHSDGEKSEANSQFDRDDRDDIFRVLNHYKSPRRSRSHSNKEEDERSEKMSQHEWKDGIPVSPISVRSRPEIVRHRTEWDDYLSRLQHSDCSELNLQHQEQQQPQQPQQLQQHQE